MLIKKKRFKDWAQKIIKKKHKKAKKQKLSTTDAFEKNLKINYYKLQHTL